MLLGARTAAWGGGGGGDLPYVRNGLEMLLDAVYSNISSGTISDLSGNGNSGTLTQYASPQDGYIEITGRSGYAIGYSGAITNEYTLEVAAEISDLDRDASPRLTAENPYPSLYLNTNSFPRRFAFYGQGKDIYFTNSTVTLGLIHTYSVSYDGTNLHGYVDGIWIGDIATTTKPSSVATATIGNRLSGGRGCKGKFYGIRRYSRCLSAQEIASNYEDDAHFTP